MERAVTYEDRKVGLHGAVDTLAILEKLIGVTAHKFLLLIGVEVLTCRSGMGGRLDQTNILKCGWWCNPLPRSRVECEGLGAYHVISLVSSALHRSICFIARVETPSTYLLRAVV